MKDGDCVKGARNAKKYTDMAFSFCILRDFSMIAQAIRRETHRCTRSEPPTCSITSFAGTASLLGKAGEAFQDPKPTYK